MQVAIQTQSSQVVTTDPSQDPRYDRFVHAHERASAYHAGAWARILRAGYGFTPSYLAVESSESGELEGVMPLMYSRGLVSGRRLRGLPVVPPVGPLGVGRRAELALVAQACELADRRACPLVFASRTAGYEEQMPGLRGREKFPTWVTPLDTDADALRQSWKKRSNNLFRSIAKAEKAGVTVREGHGEADLRVFYRLYLETMKRHRSLPRAWRQMEADMRLLGPSGVYRLFLASHDGRVVAGGLFHALGDTVDLLYNGSATSERDLRANFALYWHAIRWAIENGYRRFDWGQAKEGGTLSRFKAQWSAERVPEYVYAYVPGSDESSIARADRLRQRHDALDSPGEASRAQRMLDASWGYAPLGLTRAAGQVAYRLF